MLYTVRGVCTDITKSKYNVLIGEVRYYFSSQSVLCRFINKLDSLDELHNTISYDLQTINTLRLYDSIEKRGFYIVYRGVGYKWLKEIEEVLETS